MDNQFIYIAITPQAPIHIGDAKPAFKFLPTKDVIPGSSLRGALADFFIAQNKITQIKDFIKGIHFGFLYPTRSSTLYPYPLPSTALECKTNNGFKNPREKGHGIIDTLLISITYQELKNLGAEFPVPLTFKCQKCLEEQKSGRMEKVSGFYVRERQYEKILPFKGSQTKVAINRRKKSAEEEMLYSITSIVPRFIEYVGRIKGDEEKVDTVLEAVRTVGIGGFTRKGYGKVEVRKIDISSEPLKERLEQFNEKLKLVWQDLLSIAKGQGLPKEPLDIYFSIDLLSPTILIDEDGTPSLTPILNINGNMLKPIFSSVSSVFIGGWSDAWGLPKETQLGMQIGSTFVYKIGKETSGLYETLENLEETSIGERTDEGYGEVIICHPFHKEGEQV